MVVEVVSLLVVAGVGREISWPKDFSGGPEVTKQKGGLDEAQPVVHVSHKKGSLVKPSFLQVKSDAQSTWVLGESSSGVGCGDFESPECAAMPDLVLNASALNANPVLGALVASPFGSLEGATPDVAVCATVAPIYKQEFDGCTLMVDSGAPGAVVVVHDSSKVGSTLMNMAMVSSALKNGSRSHCRHQWVKHNRFSPLSELGNEMGTEFGEGEDRVEAFRLVDSVGFSPNDLGPLFLPWDNSGVDNCDGGSGVKDNCLLECNPVTRWDPNTIGMSQGIDDGVLKQPTNSRSRGLRELKGLISNVNYGGVFSKSRSRAPSNAVGVVGSFK
nr:hypothetical protein CFP56_73698 [Quercus suber]